MTSGVPAASEAGAQTSLAPPSGLAAGMLVGTAALIVLGVQPLLLGALTQEARLSAAQLGQVATVEALTLALGATVGPRLMLRGGMRLKTAVACLLLSLVNLSIYAAKAGWMIYLSRGVAGLLEGLALGSVVVVMTHSRHPDRTNGIFLAVSTIPQVVAADLLPMVMSANGGANAGFLLLGGLAIVGAVAAFGLADQVETPATEVFDKPVWSPAVVLTTAAIVLHYAGISGAFNYIEVLAIERRVDSQAIGAAVAATLAFQVIGAFAVAWIGWRASFRVALLTGAIVQGALILLLPTVAGPASLLVLSSAFGAVWLGIQPFQVRLLIHLDESRRAALLLTPMVLLGMSAGPFVVSFFVRAHNVSGAFWSASVLMAGAIVCYGLTIAVAPNHLRESR